MRNRFAIVLVGAQNSGKTTTMRRFESDYNEDGLARQRATLGWKRLMFHGEILEALVTWVFFVPSSPTESNESLEAKFIRERLERMPELLIIAEQINGNRYQETINFLEAQGYEVVEIVIGDEAQASPWTRWRRDGSNRNQVLEERALHIGNLFTDFINRRLRESPNS